MRRASLNSKAIGLNRRDLIKAGAFTGLGTFLAQLPVSDVFANAPQRGGILSLRVTSALPSYDFFANTATRLLLSLGPCYNSLVHFDPMNPDDIIGDLAERWDVSSDGKAYTFHLVRNAKFHDGQPFTALDVKATFDYVFNPPAGAVSMRKGALSAISSIEVVDDYTVTFHLKQPSPSLLTNLASAWMIVVPKRVIDSGTIKTEVCGTGPFKFKQYNQGVSVELIRNDEYHVPGKPMLDGVTSYIIPNENTSYNYLRTGRLDMFESLSEQQAQTLAAENNKDVVVTVNTGLRFDAIVLNATREPFTNKKVRDAISYGFDRDAAVAVLRRGPITGPFPEGKWTLPEEELRKLPGYGPDKEANRAKARELLAEAGYANGLKVTIKVLREEYIQGAAMFVQDQLSQIGIQAKIETAEVAEMIERERTRDFDMTVQAVTVPVNDPDTIFGLMYRSDSVRNLSGIHSPEIDAMIDEQSHTLDEVKRQQLVWEIQRRVLADHGVLWIHRKKRYVGLRREVRDLIVHPEPVNNSRRQDVWKAS